jgi:septal ring factor EnvC (AmiA/AmiB activator)
MAHERVVEENGVRIRWSGRTMGFIGVLFAGVITLVSSFTSFAVTHYLDDATVTQKQNDRLDTLDQRLTKLESIAQTNSEARIQMQSEIKAFEKESGLNQQQILENQRALLELLRQHERTTERRLKSGKVVPEAQDTNAPPALPIVEMVGAAPPSVVTPAAPELR